VASFCEHDTEPSGSIERVELHPLAFQERLRSTALSFPKILSRGRAHRRGCGLDIGFIDNLYAPLTTISNYNTIADFHTLQITTEHGKSFPTCCVFTSRFLVTTSSIGDTSTSALKSSLNGVWLPIVSLLHRLPYRTDLVAPVVILITSRHGPRRQHRSFLYPLPSSSRRFLLRICWIATDVLLFRGRCLETNVVSEPFASSGCFSGCAVLIQYS
jgi:hypothetical protein